VADECGLLLDVSHVAWSVCSGVYVAAVVHNVDDRVLATDDGRIPMIEVEDTASVSDASLINDYYWLLKVRAPAVAN